MIFELTSGLVAGLRGLVVKEMRTRSRGWRSMWVLTGYLALLSGAVAVYLAIMVGTTGTYPAASGLVMFYALAFGSVLLLSFITPALTTGAVSGERERRTLELLLVTRASAFGLACGKLAGSLLYVVFLLVASLPAFALVWLFGGIQLRYLLMVVAVALVTAISYAALGMVFSALLRRTALATVASYLSVLVLLAGLPIAWMVGSMVGSSQGRIVQPPGFMVGVSPLASLFSILASNEVFAGADGVAEPVPITHVVYSMYDPQTSRQERYVRLAPWVYHFTFSALITLVSLVLTAATISPIKPWRRLSWRH